MLHHMKISQKKSVILVILILFIVVIISLSSEIFISVTQLEQIPEEKGFYDAYSFDRYITYLRQLGHIPGLSACIIKNDTVVWAKGYGYYDLENNSPATENTVYRLSSITKTITGTALMQLYEQNLFDLAEDINKYLPFELRNPHHPNASITFRMLLAHSSSLRNTDTYFDYYVKDNPEIIYPYPWLKEYLIPNGTQYVPEVWNETCPPGTRGCYANVNYDLIAYLIELLSGQNLTEYCEKNIFQPLDMNNTSFFLTDFNIDQIAVPYEYSEDKYQIVRNYDVFNYPVGGIRTSIMDLSHFLIAHMNGGMYNNTRILNEETVEEMHSIQHPGNEQVNHYFGLSWLIYSFEEEKYLGHEGNFFGFHTVMLERISDDNTAIIFFMNIARENQDTINAAARIRDALFLRAEQL